MLDGIPDKRQDKNTTSLKFKEDVIKYFESKNLDLCLELGTNAGWTTRILSMLFNQVVTIEYNDSLIEQAKKNNEDRTNIKYCNINVYEDDWNIGDIDVAMIDCVHEYEHVRMDIQNCLNRNVKYIIFDDYGLPENVPSVKLAVDEYIEFDNPNAEITWIGEPVGNEPRIGRPLVDWEGVIVKI